MNKYSPQRMFFQTKKFRFRENYGTKHESLTKLFAYNSLKHNKYF